MIALSNFVKLFIGCLADEQKSLCLVLQIKKKPNYLIEG